MSRQGQHEAMDAETVADLLGVTTRQLNNYINLKDLPCDGDKRRRTFNWPDVREWYVTYRLSLERYSGNEGFDEEMEDEETSAPGSKRKEDQRSANLRKTKAEANLKELALSRQRGQVIVIADAKVRLDRMLGNLRTKLLSMPPKLAGRLDGMKERTQREDALKEEMENLCREIATGTILETPPEDAYDDRDQ